MSKTAGSFFQFVFIETAGSLLRFPVWWYGEGLLHVLRWVRKNILYRLRAYGFGLWVRNLFVPMYGQYDLAGRAVSVFMRIIVLIGRGIAFIAELFAYAFLIAFWCLLPLTAAALFIINLFQLGGGAYIYG